MELIDLFFYIALGLFGLGAIFVLWGLAERRFQGYYYSLVDRQLNDALYLSPEDAEKKRAKFSKLRLNGTAHYKLRDGSIETEEFKGTIFDYYGPFHRKFTAFKIEWGRDEMLKTLKERGYIVRKGTHPPVYVPVESLDSYWFLSDDTPPEIYGGPMDTHEDRKLRLLKIDQVINAGVARGMNPPSKET